MLLKIQNYFTVSSLKSRVAYKDIAYLSLLVKTVGKKEGKIKS
jgi:hypothetical protein